MASTDTNQTTLSDANPDDVVRRQAVVPTRVHWVVMAMIAVWTAVGIQVIRSDASWGALNIAFFSGPLVNAALVVVGLVLLFVVRAASREKSIQGPCCSIVGSAILSCATFLVTLFATNLHGC